MGFADLLPRPGWLLGVLALVSLPLCARAAEPQPPMTSRIGVQKFADNHTARFTLILADSYLGFTVPAAWRVALIESDATEATMEFEIAPDVGDGTDQPSFLAVELRPPQADLTKISLVRMRQEYADVGATAGWYRHWAMHGWHMKDDAILYTGADGQERMGNVHCRIKLSWPRLSNADYNARMNATLKRLLDSVAAQEGAYQLHPGETEMRPFNLQ